MRLILHKAIRKSLDANDDKKVWWSEFSAFLAEGNAASMGAGAAGGGAAAASDAAAVLQAAALAAEATALDAQMEGDGGGGIAML